MFFGSVFKCGRFSTAHTYRMPCMLHKAVRAFAKFISVTKAYCKQQKLLACCTCVCEIQNSLQLMLVLSENRSRQRQISKACIISVLRVLVSQLKVHFQMLYAAFVTLISVSVQIHKFIVLKPKKRNSLNDSYHSY